MKNEKELENIKEEIEKLNAELHELTDEELEQVTGGTPADEIKFGFKPVTIDEIKDERKGGISEFNPQ